MVLIKCKRCGKVWTYKGLKNPYSSYPIYINCPRCYAKNMLNRFRFWKGYRR